MLRQRHHLPRYRPSPAASTSLSFGRLDYGPFSGGTTKGGEARPLHETKPNCCIPCVTCRLMDGMLFAGARPKSPYELWRFRRRVGGGKARLIADRSMPRECIQMGRGSHLTLAVEDSPEPLKSGCSKTSCRPLQALRLPVVDPNLTQSLHVLGSRLTLDS